MVKEIQLQDQSSWGYGLNNGTYNVEDLFMIILSDGSAINLNELINDQSRLDEILNRPRQ